MKIGFMNRLVFVLAALVLLAVCLSTFVLADPLRLFSSSAISRTVENIVDALYDEASLIPALVGMFICLVICIWMFVLAFKRSKVAKIKPIDYINIGTPENGQIKVATSTINGMICKSVNEISGVKSSRAKTTVVDEKTFVTVGVSVEHGAIIPKVCEDIQTATKEKIQQLTGMVIEEINVLVNNKE